MSTSRAVEPYPEIVMDAKSYNSEASLQEDLTNLAFAVRARWGQVSAPLSIFTDLEGTWDLVGPDCVGRGMNCLADIQDTTYHTSGPQGIDCNELYAVVGTLGTALGNATYVSLGFYQSSVALGVASVTQAELAGTAADYAGAVSDPGKFYVYYVGRNCGDLAACTSITADMVPAGDALNISMREYVYPGTARSPDPTKILPPVLIELDGCDML